MFTQVEDKRVKVTDLCRRYDVARLDLFGSAVGERFDPERSDLDFIVAFEPRDPSHLFDRYFGLKEGLEVLFDRSVDLVMESTLKDDTFAENVEARRVPLYAA